MKDFEVACLNIHDVNLIIVFLDAGSDLAAQERRELYTALQASARSAGLAGSVVLVWRDTLGGTSFMAPPHQHPFFQIMSYDQLHAQVNRTLTVARALPGGRPAGHHGSGRG